jgi:hypothetical protein
MTICDWTGLTDNGGCTCGGAKREDTRLMLYFLKGAHYMSQEAKWEADVISLERRQMVRPMLYPSKGVQCMLAGKTARPALCPSKGTLYMMVKSGKTARLII